MKLRVFTLAYDPVEQRFDDAELNDFLEHRDVVSVAEHLFVHEQLPTWALMVTWREPRPAPRQGKRKNPDWVADLDEADTAVYDALRSWRNARAQEEGKPAYALFTNRQLAEIARRRPTSVSAIGEVQGIGPSRVERYGEDVLTVVASAPS